MRVHEALIQSKEGAIHIKDFDNGCTHAAADSETGQLWWYHGKERSSRVAPIRLDENNWEPVKVPKPTEAEVLRGRAIVLLKRVDKDSFEDPAFHAALRFLLKIFIDADK